MGAPQVEGCPPFREKFVALINGRNPRNRPDLVIEDLVGDVWRDAKARHSRDAGPPQVVKPPLIHSGEPIKHPLDPAKIVKRPGSKNGEDEWPLFFYPIEYRDCLLGQMNDVLLAILGP